jgi:hypothetical protein
VQVLCNAVGRAKAGLTGREAAQAVQGSGTDGREGATAVYSWNLLALLPAAGPGHRAAGRVGRKAASGITAGLRWYAPSPCSIVPCFFTLVPARLLLSYYCALFLLFLREYGWICSCSCVGTVTANDDLIREIVRPQVKSASLPRRRMLCLCSLPPAA